MKMSLLQNSRIILLSAMLVGGNGMAMAAGKPLQNTICIH